MEISQTGAFISRQIQKRAIEDDKYFLTVLRYIHQNPIKAKLCKRIDDYKLSSYNDYINPKEGQVTDIDFALGMLSKDEFIRFHSEKNYDECLEIEENDFRLNDEEAKVIIFKVSKCKSVADFQALEIKKRDKYIKKLKEKDLSIRQISRLTGISFGIVRKV